MRRLELRDDAFEIMSGRPDYDHHCTRMVGADRWRDKEDRIPSDQAVVDETFCEGLCTVRTFEVRLLDGMNPTVPEVTVLIHGSAKDCRAGEYRLDIKKVLGADIGTDGGKSRSGDQPMYELINQKQCWL